MKRLKATLDGVEQEQVGLRHSIQKTKQMSDDADTMMLRSRGANDAEAANGNESPGVDAEPPLMA